jgi:hypothetical protein
MNNLELIRRLSEIVGVMNCDRELAIELLNNLINMVTEELTGYYRVDQCEHEWKPLYQLNEMFCPKCGMREE